MSIGYLSIVQPNYGNLKLTPMVHRSITPYYSYRKVYPMVDAYYTTDESHYNECIEKGTIVPTKDWYGKRLCVEDFLAGDHRYIFMFVNDRYSIFDEDGKDNTFGFVLDAELLVTESNALVGPDLLNEYRSLINECATFSVQQNPALKNAQLIVRGVLAGAVTEPGVAETMLLFRTRVSELQNERRCQGEAALKRLRESTEPLELLVGGSSPSPR